MHIGIANPRWRGKRSRHSRRMHNSHFYVTGKRPMDIRKCVNFWYQKSIFWYQKILFWYQIIFWYQKMSRFSDIKNQKFPIFLYQKIEFLISENHFLISENRHKSPIWRSIICHWTASSVQVTFDSSCQMFTGRHVLNSKIKHYLLLSDTVYLGQIGLNFVTGTRWPSIWWTFWNAISSIKLFWFQ